MLNKSEKKYFFMKVFVVLAVLFLIMMAFITPKTTIQHIEKPYNLSTHE